MAKKNAAQQIAQKKAKKQKKVLIGLGLLLVLALVYAFTTLSHLGGSPSASATTPAATTPDGSAPAGTPIAAVIPGIAAPPTGSLGAFTALGRKDPFNDGGPDASAAPASSTSGKGSGNGSGSGVTSTPKQPSAPLTGAVISINGTKLGLAVGANFGHAPGLSGVWLFRLIKVTPRTALIGVVGTRQQFTLHRRKPLTLEQWGGWRYTLILEPIGTATPMTVQPTTTTTGP